MTQEFSNITGEQLQSFVELFTPCMDDYLFVCDFKKDDYRISPSAVKRFLLPTDYFGNVTEELQKVAYEEDVEMLMVELQLLSQGKKEFHNLHYRWLDHARKPIWINCRGRVLKDEDGSPHFLVGCINEIGAKQKADNVSGLLGESSFVTYYESFAGKLPSGFILRVGIDDFKDVNENQGIEYGDFVLQKTAGCIAANIRQGQQLFRIVADEFIVADFMGGSVEDAMELYRNICADVAKFIEEGQYVTVYTVSGGILPNDDPGRSCGTAMKLSEFALSEAKRGGKNSCHVFLQEEYAVYLRKKELTSMLHHSVKHQFEGFEAYFQPLVGAEDSKLTGAEALMRFHAPDGTMISPGEFIPILEETGLIIPVGKWMLRESLSACRKFQRYLPGFKMNVNLSYIQVRKSDVLHDIIGILEEYGLSPASVCVELTESGYLEENPHFVQVWNGLKEYGVLLALDDFGTGYSNLHCLSDLKPSYVKIDRTFMSKALKRDYEYQLLTHIIEMAHSLDLYVCAEGIENEEELRRAQETGPDYIQGFLFGRPGRRLAVFQKFFSSMH